MNISGRKLKRPSPAYRENRAAGVTVLASLAVLPQIKYPFTVRMCYHAPTRDRPNQPYLGTMGTNQ